MARHIEGQGRKLMIDTTLNTANSPVSLSTRITQIADLIKRQRNEFLTTKDLTSGQDDYLIALHNADGITMGNLAETIGISPSSATKIAIKLEEAGYLRREASRIDSRQNHAFLTEAGEALVNEILSTYQLLDQALVAKIKSKDIERAFKIFDRIDKGPKIVEKSPKKAGTKKSRLKEPKKRGAKQKKKSA